MVISDSGNHGAYAIIDPETGKLLERGNVPLADTSNDLEGLASRDGVIYGLLSAGWIYRWKRVGTTFERIGEPYPIGEVTLSIKKSHDKPPEGDGMVCPAKGTNCGRDYEGLALVDAAHARGPCVGFAAAKADGHLYCLTEHDGKLIADHAIAIAVDKPGAMADCAFGDDGTLWAGDNLFGASQVYRIDNWQDPPHATVEPVAMLGLGFQETIAARGDVLYRMSDTGGSPSLMSKFRCRPPAK